MSGWHDELHILAGGLLLGALMRGGAGDDDAPLIVVGPIIDDDGTYTPTLIVETRWSETRRWRVTIEPDPDVEEP